LQGDNFAKKEIMRYDKDRFRYFLFSSIDLWPYNFYFMSESTFDIAKFKMLLSDMIQTKIPDLHFSSRHAPYLRDLNGDIAYLENF